MKRALLAAAVLFAPPAFAQTAKKPTPPPVAPPPTHLTAIAKVAADAASAIGEVSAGAIVVASPIASDIPLPHGDELAVRIAAQIAGKLGSAKAHPQAAPLAVARGLSGRAASLVYVQLEIAKGELRATVDLYPVVSNGWERLRNPVPGPRAHTFVTAPIDAEVRAFSTPILLEQARLRKAKHDEGDVLAVGCGDVDGDGGLEIVLVSRARVAVGKLRAGKFVPSRTLPWDKIAARAPVPLREPLASVVFGDGELLLGMTDRAPVAVDATLAAKHALSGLPLPGLDACVVPRADIGALSGNAVACALPAKGDPAAVFAPPVSKYDAIAALDVVDRDGGVGRVLAVREPSAKLTIRRDGAKPIDTTIDNAGAQLALVDLDLDGTPEIVTSADSGDDAISVKSLVNGNAVPRLHFAAKEGVRAITSCPPEERGLPGIAAVVGGEVWLVR